MYTECPSKEEEIQEVSYYPCTPLIDALERENCFATVPMPVITPLYQRPDEEQLHMDFERAISGRLLDVQKQLTQLEMRRISSQLEHEQAQITTEPLQDLKASSSFLSSIWQMWQVGQRGIIFTCLALLCMLIGFDLMGLLILHMH